MGNISGSKGNQRQNEKNKKKRGIFPALKEIKDSTKKIKRKTGNIFGSRGNQRPSEKIKKKREIISGSKGNQRQTKKIKKTWNIFGSKENQ